MGKDQPMIDTSSERNDREDSMNTDTDLVPADVVSLFVMCFLAVVLAMVLVFILARLVTRLSRRSSWHTVNPNGTQRIRQRRRQQRNRVSTRRSSAVANERRRETSVAVRAKISGMTQKERISVLEAVFLSTTFRFPSIVDKDNQFHREPQDCIQNEENIENDGKPHAKSDRTQEGAGKLRDGASDCSADEDCSATCFDDTFDDMDDTEQGIGTSNLELVCCICLLEYNTNDLVMYGSSCRNHYFHVDCCMEWLAKHDHCPYCRQDMMTPTEMRRAALLVLGQDRVAQLEASSSPTSQSDDSLHEQAPATVNNPNTFRLQNNDVDTTEVEQAS